MDTPQAIPSELHVAPSADKMSNSVASMDATEPFLVCPVCAEVSNVVNTFVSATSVLLPGLRRDDARAAEPAMRPHCLPHVLQGAADQHHQGRPAHPMPVLQG